MATDTNLPPTNGQPEISKHATVMASESAETDTKNDATAPASHSAGVSIQPLASSQVSQSELQDQADAAHATSEQKEESADSAYEASDSLPDVSKTLTTEATDTMQAPRIYDTKEYIVPIHDTVHSHGTIGKIVAGFISALVVISLVYLLSIAVINNNQSTNDSVQSTAASSKIVTSKNGGFTIAVPDGWKSDQYTDVKNNLESISFKAADGFTLFVNVIGEAPPDYPPVYKQYDDKQISINGIGEVTVKFFTNKAASKELNVLELYSQAGKDYIVSPKKSNVYVMAWSEPFPDSMSTVESMGPNEFKESRTVEQALEILSSITWQ